MSTKHNPNDGETPEVITSDLNSNVVLSENEDGTKVIARPGYEAAPHREVVSHNADGTEVVKAAPNDAHTTFEGEPNGLPPAAPEVQLDAPDEVKKLREWFHHHVKNSVHSQDTVHYNHVYQMTEALAATLHSKHPVQKET